MVEEGREGGRVRMVYKVLARGDLTSDLNARERERKVGALPAVVPSPD